MLVTASRVRTTLAIGAASATVLAALLLHPATGPIKAVDAPPDPADRADDGMKLTARMTSQEVLPGEQGIAITITAPAGKGAVRPPVSLAVVIDRSGSMSGLPLENAKTAAQKLVDRLAPGDAFSIVTYSTSDETVMPMSLATAANKDQARRAIAAIYDDGGTCISCGINRGANELSRTPISQSVERIVLISDGRANEGVSDRDELARLAQQTAAKGTSITTMGVGLDFDEVTMQRLAEVGRGNYYFVEDTANLEGIFAAELGGLAETIGSDVSLVLTEGPGVSIQDVYGYPMTRNGSQIIVPVADIRAGETRKVVVRTLVAEGAGSRMISSVQLGWRRVSDGAGRRATATARATLTTDATRVAATVDADAALAVEQAESARALEEASHEYETRGAAAAQQVMDKRVAKARAKGYLNEATVQSIAADAAEAGGAFSAAPATSAAGKKAQKVQRAKAFKLAR